MKSIVRPQFLDLLWDASDLDAAAQLWLHLYDIAAKFYGYSITPRYSLELRLWGFPLKMADSLADELEDRAEPMGRANRVVTLADPDTLVLSCDEVDTPTPPPAGLGLPLLAGPEFEGLAVEIRFRVIGLRPGIVGFGKYGNMIQIAVTLVILGEVRGGNLLVKTLWKSHDGFDEDEQYRTAAIPAESEFVRAFDEFHRNRTITHPDLAACFGPAAAPGRLQRALSWVVNAPFGRPRLLGLLVRFTVLVGLAATAGWMVYRAQVHRETHWGWVGTFTGLISVPLLWTFLRTESSYLFSYRATRRALVKALDEWPSRIQFKVLTLEETPAFVDDPAIRKQTADLIAEGFTHLGDISEVSAVATRGCSRIFRAPDRVTYLILRCRLTRNDDTGACGQVWPAGINFTAETFYQGGARVESVTGLTHAVQRRATGQATLLSAFSGLTDPVEFYHRHREVADGFAAEKGLTPLPVRPDRFEDYVHHLELLYEAEWQHTRDHLYSLGDHLRWYLQWPRRRQGG